MGRGINKMINKELLFKTLTWVDQFQQSQDNKGKTHCFKYYKTLTVCSVSNQIWDKNKKHDEKIGANHTAGNILKDRGITFVTRRAMARTKQQ